MGPHATMQSNRHSTILSLMFISLQRRFTLESLANELQFLLKLIYLCLIKYFYTGFNDFKRFIMILMCGSVPHGTRYMYGIERQHTGFP